MSDHFAVNTKELATAAHMIKKDTDTLRGQTDHHIEQIDSTSQSLPQALYPLLLPILSNIKAYLNRSMDIRDRISTVLGEVAQAVEKQENQITHSFAQLTPPESQSHK